MFTIIYLEASTHFDSVSVNTEPLARSRLSEPRLSAKEAELCAGPGHGRFREQVYTEAHCIEVRASHPFDFARNLTGSEYPSTSFSGASL